MGGRIVGKIATFVAKNQFVFHAVDNYQMKSCLWMIIDISYLLIMEVDLNT